MGRKSASFTSLVEMFTARQKIKKEKGQPTELENQVAQALVDLEINNEELRPFLKNLHIAGAKEVVVNKSTAAIVSFRRSSLASTSCSWLSARFRIRSPETTARPPRARFAPTPVPSPACTRPSCRTLCTPLTSAASVSACSWTATS